VADSMGARVWVHQLNRQSKSGHSVRKLIHLVDEGSLLVRAFRSIVLLVGTVDILQIYDKLFFVTPAQVAERIIQLLVKIHQLNPDASVGVSNILPMSSGKYSGKRLSDINAFIVEVNSCLKTLLLKYRFVQLINSHKCFICNSSPKVDLFDHTGYHLSGAGARILSMRFKHFLGTH